MPDFRGEYPGNWPEIKRRNKEEAGYCCVRCGVYNSRKGWNILTTHHIDNDKSNCRWWNLAALCQRCHLKIQGRVTISQRYLFEHTEWFKPYAAGYYAFTLLGEELTREAVMERLDELLAVGQPEVYG